MRRIFYRFSRLLILVGFIFTTACAAAANDQPTPTPIPLPTTSAKATYTVTRGDIMAQVQFTARVIPSVLDELFFRSDGRVRKVYVRPGDSVIAGQVLADMLQLDDLETQKRLQDFSIRRAQIALEMAQLDQQILPTQIPFWSYNYTTELKKQELEVELAQIALNETQARNQNLDTAIANAQIISPINGKVLLISLLEGNEIRAYTSVITVGDDSQLEIGATLIASQLQTLAEGMPAVIELPSRPNEKLQGALRSLPYPYGTNGGGPSEGQSTGAASSSETIARVALSNPNDLASLKLGDLVNVSIIIESKTNVLWLPPSAIRTYEGRNFVVIQTDGLPRRVDIKIGIANEEKVEILEGLEEGQIVIAP